MSIGIIPLFVLVIVAIVAIPVLIGIFRRAEERNPNQPGGEEDRERQEQERGEQHR